MIKIKVKKLNFKQLRPKKNSQDKIKFKQWNQTKSIFRTITRRVKTNKTLNNLDNSRTINTNVNNQKKWCNIKPETKNLFSRLVLYKSAK